MVTSPDVMVDFEMAENDRVLLIYVSPPEGSSLLVRAASGSPFMAGLSEFGSKVLDPGDRLRINLPAKTKQVDLIRRGR